MYVGFRSVTFCCTYVLGVVRWPPYCTRISVVVAVTVAVMNLCLSGPWQQHFPGSW